jgi:hypothetical protein
MEVESARDTKWTALALLLLPKVRTGSSPIIHTNTDNSSPFPICAVSEGAFDADHLQPIVRLRIDTASVILAE